VAQFFLQKNVFTKNVLEKATGNSNDKVRRSALSEVFKLLSIGGVTKENLLDCLISAGIKFNAYAEILFKNQLFIPNEQRSIVNLVKMSLNDLNLENECTYAEIIKRSSSVGLKLCPLYLGAFLRLKYLDQPEGPYLTIASCPLGSDGSYPNGFYIRNLDGTNWLRGYKVEGKVDCPTNHEFLFII
jgi:hypothetical protein